MTVIGHEHAPRRMNLESPWCFPSWSQRHIVLVVQWESFRNKVERLLTDLGLIKGEDAVTTNAGD